MFKFKRKKTIEKNKQNEIAKEIGNKKQTEDKEIINSINSCFNTMINSKKWEKEKNKK